jgi:microcystin-dependent protein
MSSPFIGEIRMFAGNFAPAGWAFCDGSLLSISEFTALFQLIGTTYGGDGQTTFALPDLRSRVPVHVGPGFVLGQSGGVETVTLTVSQLPAHTHAAAADNNTGTAAAPGGNVWAASNNYYQFAPGSGAATPMNAGAVALSGGNQPHDNMIPFLAVNFILSLFGIFPSQ